MLGHYSPSFAPSLFSSCCCLPQSPIGQFNQGAQSWWAELLFHHTAVLSVEELRLHSSSFSIFGLACPFVPLIDHFSLLHSPPDLPIT